VLAVVVEDVEGGLHAVVGRVADQLVSLAGLDVCE
jgi:hypothetical protein